MSSGKAMTIHLIARLMKQSLHKMSQYFVKPYKPFGEAINVKFDLYNYGTKADFKKSNIIWYV